jgi:hypothetical protein
VILKDEPQKLITKMTTHRRHYGGLEATVCI